METYLVQSRLVRSIAFRSSDGRLWIQFQNGEERQFDGVPRQQFDDFLNAPSPGQYYLDHIRNRFLRVAA